MGQSARETPEYVLFIEQPAEFWIGESGRTGHCKFVTGDATYEVVFSVPTMLQGMANASKAYVESLKRTAARVIPFRRAH